MLTCKIYLLCGRIYTPDSDILKFTVFVVVDIVDVPDIN